MSGGEQQRVAIARALINKPALILADEPTGNLDSQTGEDILNILKELNIKQHKTVVVITHNEYAEKFASRVFVMKDGMLKDAR
jgi:putative ABC transport system ATP-binding protein